MADIGSISGGWLSSYFIRKGWSINKSRKLTLLLCALIILPVMFVTKVKTGFKVTPDNIEQLAQTEIKVREKGRKKTVRVPDILIEDIRKFEGREYKAARDFADSLQLAHGATILRDHINMITDNSRTEKGTFMISNKTVDVLVKQDLSEDLILGLKKINSQKIKNKEKKTVTEFTQYVEKSIGKYSLELYQAEIFDRMRTNNLYWIAILLIALAAGGHQAWAANIFTVVSDVFPKKATASVIGIGGMIGAFAGIVADKILASLLEGSGPSGYFFAFLGAGLIYLITLGIVHILMPDMTPLGEDLKPVKK
jgi:MFS family permease